MSADAAHPFWTVLAARKALAAEREEAPRAAQKVFEAAILAAANAALAASKKKPKPLTTLAQARDCKEFSVSAWEAIFKEHAARLEAQLDDLKPREEELDAELKALAPSVPLGAVKTTWALYTTRMTDTYRSQGWGAMTYAREAAELEAEDLRRIGAEVRVDWCPYEDREGGVFEVRVHVAEEREVEVLARLFAGRMTIAEYARACWRHGVNPRVYLPGLPFRPEFEPA